MAWTATCNNYLNMSKASYVTNKLPLFEGTMADWPWWEEVFLARAKKDGYKDVLKDGVAVPEANKTTYTVEEDKKYLT